MDETTLATSGGTELVGTDWRLASYGAIDAPSPAAANPPTLRLGDDGRISGFAGCNRYFGSYQSTSNHLILSPLASTRMACVDPAQEQQEHIFLTALMGTVRYELADRSLRIFYNDDRFVLIFDADLEYLTPLIL